MKMDFRQLVQKERLEGRERMKKETEGTYVILYFVIGLYIVSSALWGFRVESVLESPYLFLPCLGFLACAVQNRYYVKVKENGKFENIFEKYRYIPIRAERLFLAKLAVISRNIAVQTAAAQALALTVRLLDLDRDGGKVSDITVWVPLMSGVLYQIVLAGSLAMNARAGFKMFGRKLDF